MECGQESSAPKFHQTEEQLDLSGYSRGKEMSGFQARLCGLGYTQIAGVDSNANYAPVINDVTLRILLVLKMLMNWNAELIDIEIAFLH